MADGGANDDAGRRRGTTPGGDDAVEPLGLDDSTDRSPDGNGGQRDRGGRARTPDLELIEPVEFDLPADELTEPPTDAGSTPPDDDHDESSRDEGAPIVGERLLAALVEALGDERLDAQVAAVRRELAVDPNPELDARLDRLEAALEAAVEERNVEKRNVEERIKRLETAVETLASRVATDGAHDASPSAEPAARDDLREELAAVRAGLEKLAVHVNERTAAIEPLEEHVEELRQWQQAVRAVAVQREED